MLHPTDVLKKLGLSDSEITLYLALLSRGSFRVNELVQVTCGKRPTVYYALRQLIARGLVKTIPGHSIQRFQAEPPETLLTMLELREQEIQHLREEVQRVIPELSVRKEPGEGAPVVTFYEGREGMKHVVMETLYCTSRHIDSIAPKDNFFWHIGQSFSQRYIDERVARNITTRNLWEQPLKPELLFRSYKELSEVRILPPSMHGRFRTTVFLYDDKVMYISSIKNAYVLLVQSPEHAELVRTMYDAIWEISTRHVQKTKTAQDVRL